MIGNIKERLEKIQQALFESVYSEETWSEPKRNTFPFDILRFIQSKGKEGVKTADLTRKWKNQSINFYKDTPFYRSGVVDVDKEGKITITRLGDAALKWGLENPPYEGPKERDPGKGGRALPLERDHFLNPYVGSNAHKILAHIKDVEKINNSDLQRAFARIDTRVFSGNGPLAMSGTVDVKKIRTKEGYVKEVIYSLSSKGEQLLKKAESGAIRREKKRDPEFWKLISEPF